MLGRRHVAEHGRSERGDHCAADRRCDVIVSGRDVGHEGPKRIEGRTAAELLLQSLVFLDPVHRHVPGPFDEALHARLVAARRKSADHPQLAVLSFVARIGNAPRAQAVSERERHVIVAADFKELVEMLVGHVLASVREHPACHDRAAAGDDAQNALCRMRKEL